MNRPTLQQIEAFFWTATLGSVQKAAEKLSLSQPAVSLRLKEFEASIGGPIFQRSGRRLTSTPRSSELLRNARIVLDAVDGLGTAAAASVSGSVKVGFAEGFALTCLPQIMERLHARYPDVHPELTVATSSSIEPALQASRLDLAFLVEPREIEGFTYVYLGLQPTAWVASADFDLAEPVTPNMLEKERIIANQPGTIGYRQLVRWFASEGLKPAHLDICSSVAVQAKLIESGTGVGILPTKMIESSVMSGSLRLFETFPPVQPVAIFLVHRAETLSPAARALFQCVTDTLAQANYLISER